MAEEAQARILGWVDDARAVFAERWGIEAPVAFFVGSNREVLAPDYFRLRGKHVSDLLCANHRDGIVFILPNCLSERTVRHEYFHAIQDALSELSHSLLVYWLTEGTAEYAELINRADADLGLRLDRERARSVSVLTRRIAVPSLESLESREAFRENRDTGYRLGFLAAQRLIDRSSEAAMLDFYRSLTATADWREAFEAAFGIAPDAFYADFEAYRARVAQPLPHLTDEREGPALVFVGDVPDETQAAVRAEFGRVRAFFTSRFGTPEPEFTIHAGPDASSLAATHLRTFGMEIEDGFHGRATGSGKVSIIALDSAASPPHNLDWHYHFHVRANLAPWGALPDAPEDYDRRGPLWLVRGVQEFVKAAYRASADIETYENAHSRHVSRASRTKRLLGGVVTQADLDAMGAGQSNALGFLAAERLVALAGEPALFEYYTALPDAADWREAFEAAFGIAPDAFYADFEAYRARAAQPLPHLTDDREGPDLVFVGDVPDETQAAVRAEFGRVRAFFTSRFGTPEPEFTIYAGPDASSLAATHLRTFGMEIEDGFHGRAAGDGAVSIITLDGAASPPHNLDWHYHFHVRANLAPWGALPEVPDGHDPLGPLWLVLGTNDYTYYAYRVLAGADTLERVRNEQISRASRTAAPLSSLQTHADADDAGGWEARALGFLAAERLAERAGEPALFEYYAALPDAADWREAFEAAFGIAPDAFYADFEAYRGRVAPPADGAP